MSLTKIERLLMQQAWQLAETLRELREDADAATASAASATDADAEEDAAIDASWKARRNR